MPKVSKIGILSAVYGKLKRTKMYNSYKTYVVYMNCTKHENKKDAKAVAFASFYLSAFL